MPQLPQPNTIQMLADLASEVKQLAGEVKQLADVVNSQQSFFSKWVPAIVGIGSSITALIVGTLTYKASKAQQRTSQNLSTAQIQATKDVTISQIKASLVSASRKEWIENLRLATSRLTALADQLHTFRITNRALDDKLWEEIKEKGVYPQDISN